MPEELHKLSRSELGDRLERLQSQNIVSAELVDLMMEIELRDAYAGPPAFRYYDAIASTSQRLNYDRGLVFTAFMDAIEHYFRSRHADSLKGLMQVRLQMEGIDDDRLMVMLYGAMAEVHKSLGNYESALQCAFDGLELARESGEELQTAWFYHGLASGSNDLGDHTRALEYSQKGREKFEELSGQTSEIRVRVGIARTLIETGNALFGLGRIAEATEALQQALSIVESVDNQMGVSRALTDLGRIAQEEGRLDDAEALHLRALEIRREVPIIQAQATSLLHLGRLHHAKGETETAIQLLREALGIAEHTGVRLRQYQIHEALSLAFEQMADFSSALEHHRQFHSLKEQVSNDSLNGRISDMQMRFEVASAEKEAEIERLRNVELKETLDELKSAQDRLVHAEKMASLGSMTAGIAHEIKNPLNFVNNFSALSKEIVDELMAVLDSSKAGDGPPAGEHVTELLNDLAENARRIREHGQRADRIVKSMLMHAGGEKTLKKSVDLNGLLDEYTTLAYHGMRARNPDFNVTILKNLASEPQIVEAAPQEIGRVFLNLLGNAFDSVFSRSLSGEDAGYDPRVEIRTSRNGDWIEASVSDNGPGIPAENRSRIFEPFFTTKPTGEGTGLGLSLSYDIVVQGHSGELVLDENENGATFRVRLPVPQSDDTNWTVVSE